MGGVTMHIPRGNIAPGRGGAMVETARDGHCCERYAGACNASLCQISTSVLAFNKKSY